MNDLRTRDLTKRFFRAERDALSGVDLDLGRGEVMAVLGESGSGKTTLLRLIAGLDHPTRGTIEIGGQTVFDGRRTVPPERRGVGLVFQEGSLFPHLSVRENVRFGLHRRPAAEQKRRAMEMLALVGLEDMAARYPHELSGGQQQRVALARALAPSPTVLLLDEPFSNLDVVLKHAVRNEVVDIIRRSGTTAIFVLHDADDALSVADRVAVLRDGVLQQVAEPQVLYARPANEYVARFFGRINVLPAIAADGVLRTPLGCVACPNAMLASEERSVVLTVRPECIALHDAADVVAADAGASACVRCVRFLGDRCELTVSVEGLDGAPQEVVLYASPSRSPASGENVRIGIVGSVTLLGE